MSILFRPLLGASALAICLASSAMAATPELIAAAKKEGQVTWYTTQIVNQLVVPVQKAFEAKYGVKINYVRGNTGDVVLRVLNEIKAGRVECDVFDGLSTVATLRREPGVVLQWTPDEAKNYPPERVDPEGYWTATYLAISVPAVNTNLVPAGQEPKSWEDLLDPKWKGKIAWSMSNSSTSGAGFVGSVLDTYGQEKGIDYLRKLAKQNVVNIPVASRQVLDQVIAGEYSIAIQISNHHAWISAKQGAPVKWLPINPAQVNSGNISVSAKAPHPNAAKLLADFLVSPEGQAIYRDSGYIPANPKVAALDPSLVPDGKNFIGKFYTPEKLDEELPKWEKVFNEIFK
jgi:ABC-type Fe3+ transport system substrate-binding protein